MNQFKQQIIPCGMLELIRHNTSVHTHLIMAWDISSIWAGWGRPLGAGSESKMTWANGCFHSYKASCFTKDCINYADKICKKLFWSLTIYNVDKYQSLTMLNFDQWLVIFHSKGHIASISQCKKLPFALIFKLRIFEVWNLTSKSGNTGSTSTGVTPGLL